MVVIGGITWLTGSGLSITEWTHHGRRAPLNKAGMAEAFAKYQAIPEYRLIQQPHGPRRVQRIFFWEYLHRNWGRPHGLVFFIPSWCLAAGDVLRGWSLRRGWAILVAGGLVGAGWFMVKSGPSDDPDVSHFRLAIHLCAAFTVFSLVAWTAMDLRTGRRSLRGRWHPVARWTRILLVVLFVQVVWGAFTAGLDAGRIYNTWPLMNGHFMPENVGLRQLVEGPGRPPGRGAVRAPEPGVAGGRGLRGRGRALPPGGHAEGASGHCSWARCCCSSCWACSPCSRRCSWSWACCTNRGARVCWRCCWWRCTAPGALFPAECAGEMPDVLPQPGGDGRQESAFGRQRK